ncbi:hypothetical protein BIV57_16035 [Mangrovactinospora gilvigrisea]|uniref:histidine kinase n=1 Tax=Mangrovactinospora gilvigrisea TaxID=1428644 RepID=A0A1J7CA00_9ACTN|nr:hypothetical protein BIV57_16035 [Mangrovactinospora gilvigrisea]
MLAIIGVATTGQIANYRNAERTVANAKLETALQAFLQETQKERGLTTGYVNGNKVLKPQLPAQRARTDRTLAALRAQLAGRNDLVAQQLRSSLHLTVGLAAIRQDADDGTGRWDTTYTYFTHMNRVLDGLSLGLDQATDPQLRNAVLALQALSESKEFTGEERAYLLGNLGSGRFHTMDAFNGFVALVAEHQLGRSHFDTWATPDQRQKLDDAYATPAAQRAHGYEQTALAGHGRLSPRDVPATGWYNAMTSFITGMRSVQISVGDDIVTRAGSLQDAAVREFVLFGIVAAGVVALLGGLALATARAVSRPLAALTEQAADLAEHRLPESVDRAQTAAAGDRPVPPADIVVPDYSGAEVRQVAEALDRVQRVAFDLATEQAVLRRNATESLVNLGRRNQNLVRRQINFINRLEHEDADPGTLANLFELDHLATRMRRNAESLLVLAGEKTPRPWSSPLLITDVIRAALSEVEDYRRVTLRRVDKVLVSGTVVAEVAHLLAELIENALSCSPPDTEVEIEGRRTSSGYLVAVVDHGVGMESDALAEANVRLSGSAGFMAEPTRFLGHYVVGALAQRHGIEVRLGEAPAAGVVARVLLPEHVLAEAPRRRAKAEAEAGAEAVAEAPAEPAGGLVPGPRKAVAAAAAPTAAPPASVRSSEGARTRNGLVKRPRRSAIQAAVAEGGSGWTAGEERTPDRSPDEVKSMLSTLRSAHMRGAIGARGEKTDRAAKTDRAEMAEPAETPDRHEKSADPATSEPPKDDAS